MEKVVIVKPLKGDKKGCSFIPNFLLDTKINECCKRHDTVYRSCIGNWLTKIKADLNLCFSVILYGFLTLLSGLWSLIKGFWFIVLGILMGFVTICFGWWAWFYYRPK